jgi:hypothetical protein
VDFAIFRDLTRMKVALKFIEGNRGHCKPPTSRGTHGGDPVGHLLRSSTGSGQRPLQPSLSRYLVSVRVEIPSLPAIFPLSAPSRSILRSLPVVALSSFAGRPPSFPQARICARL